MDEIISAVDAQQETGVEKVKWYEGVSLEDAKAIIKANITTAARSFIAIGYYLKHIRDKELYIEDGHASIWEFAQAEYGISKSTASRYMTMNDRFSSGGNSPTVDAKYQEFGKSQLQEMLSLNDEQLEQVTPDMTVLDIRDMTRPEEPEQPEEVQIPGQMSIEEFAEFLPENMLVESNILEPEPLKEKQNFTLSLEDMLGDDDSETEEPFVAISQQAKGKCMHRPEFPCSLTSDQMLSAGNGVDCSNHCCWECHKHGDCKLECNSSVNRPWEEEEIDESFGIGELPQAKEKYVRLLAESMVKEQGAKRIMPGELTRMSDETAEKRVKEFSDQHRDGIDLGGGVVSWACDGFIEFYHGEEDLGVCSYARFATQARKAMDAWFEDFESRVEIKVEEPEVIEGEFTEIIDSELELAKEILEDNKRLLGKFMEADIENVDDEPAVKKQKIIVGALELYVSWKESANVEK